MDFTDVYSQRGKKTEEEQETKSPEVSQAEIKQEELRNTWRNHPWTAEFLGRIKESEVKLIEDLISLASQSSDVRVAKIATKIITQREIQAYGR